MSEREKNPVGEMPTEHSPNEQETTPDAETPGVVPSAERGASGDPRFAHHPEGYVPPDRGPSQEWLAHIEQVRAEIASFTDEDFEKMLETMESGEPMEFRELGVHEDKLLLYRLRNAARERMIAIDGFAASLRKTYDINPDVAPAGMGARIADKVRRMRDQRYVNDLSQYRAMRRKSANVIERLNVLKLKLDQPDEYGRFHDIDSAMQDLEQDIRKVTGVEARDILNDALEPKERKMIERARKQDPGFDGRIKKYADARKVMVAVMESNGIDIDVLPNADDGLVDDSAIR